MVDDSGLEVIRKAAEEVTPGDKSAYYLLVRVAAEIPGLSAAVWRDGSGAPSNALGNDGDYYLDTASGDVYTRASSSYSVVGNIMGPTGATGSAGATGADGDPGGTGFTFVFGNGVDIATGTGLGNALPVPFACTIEKWFTVCRTAPVGADLIFDINKNGTSLWDSNPSNRPKIVDGNTSGSGTNFDTTSLAEGDILSTDVDQVGSTTPGKTATLILRVVKSG